MGARRRANAGLRLGSVRDLGQRRPELDPALLERLLGDVAWLIGVAVLVLATDWLTAAGEVGFRSTAGDVASKTYKTPPRNLGATLA